MNKLLSRRIEIMSHYFVEQISKPVCLSCNFYSGALHLKLYYIINSLYNDCVLWARMY